MNIARGLAYGAVTAIAIIGVTSCDTGATTESTPPSSAPQNERYDELRHLAADPFTPVDPANVTIDITGIPGAGEFLNPSQELRSAGYVAIAAFGDKCVIILSTASTLDPSRVSVAVLTRYDLSRDRITGDLTHEQLIWFADRSLDDC